MVPNVYFSKMTLLYFKRPVKHIFKELSFYSRRYVNRLAEIARSQYCSIGNKLLFMSFYERQTVFQILNDILCFTPVLVFPEPNQ